MASVVYFFNEEDQVHAILNRLDYNYDTTLASAQIKMELVSARKLRALLLSREKRFKNHDNL